MSFDLFDVRSVLFLPASNPRAIAKARESTADLVVLDLEDAVKPADKKAARERGGRRRRRQTGRCRSRSGSTASGPNGIRSTSMPLPGRRLRLGSSSEGGVGASCPRSPRGDRQAAAGDDRDGCGRACGAGIAHEAAALIAGTNDLPRRPALAAGCDARADLGRASDHRPFGACGTGSRRSTACSTS